jgi:hypothetical protein
MIAWLINTAAVAGPVLHGAFLQSNAQDENGGGWLLAAGPAAGIAVYTMLFRYYRNTDKSHSFERETIIESKPVTGSDAKVDEVRGTKRTSIPGNNVSSHRERVQRVE